MNSLSKIVFVASNVMAMAASADIYIDPKPLADAAPPQIRDCRKLDAIRIPMRMSGGDIISLYANDYQTGKAAGGIYAANGIDASLILQNGIVDQLKAYLACETPVMKATQSMLNMAADVTEQDSRTEMIGVFQYGWSNGDVVLVVRPSINTPADLSGATIVTQAYGPHIGYMARILDDAKLNVETQGDSWKEPTIRYSKDLVGLEGSTPTLAFLSDEDIDAAFVTKTDADILTAGKIGTGAEGSVEGAYTLLSTRSASRIISDVLVVRRDYFEAYPDQIKALVNASFEAEEKVREDVLKQVVEWADIGAALLGDRGAIDEAKDLWRTYETVGLKGNTDWAVSSQPRSFQSVNNDIQSYLVAVGMLSSAHNLGVADWSFEDEFGEGIFDKRVVALPGFDDNKASSAISQHRQQGDIDQSTLFTFEISFEPNQTTFPSSKYEEKFKDVIDSASTYAGAILVVEGHSDPLKYLKMQHEGEAAARLDRIRKSAENLSYRRAAAVRDSIIGAAGEQGVGLDGSQFVVSGMGIDDPKTGICGKDPCPPGTEAEWRSNMRVSFRLVNLESEAAIFTPVNDW